MTSKKTTASRSSKKSAYARKTEARIEEAKATMDSVRAKTKGAIADGQIKMLKKWDEAEDQANSHFATAQRRLKRLKDASDDSWEDWTEGVEDAWDDLADEIKKIATRFSDD